MGGGSPSSTTSTSTSQLPKWATGTAQEFLGAAGNQYFPGGQIAPSPLPNQQVAPFTQAQLAGQQLGEQSVGTTLSGVPYAQGSAAQTAAQTGDTQAALGTAQNANTAIAAGQNLNPQTNQYLQEYYNAAAQPVIQNYEQAVAPNILSNAVAAGGLGSSGSEQAFSNAQSQLGQQLGNLSANIYEPAYEQGLQQQAAAIGQAPSLATGQYTPASELGQAAQTLYGAGSQVSGAGNTLAGIGGQQQQQAQDVLQTGYQNQTQQAMWPYTALQMFGPTIGQAIGNAGTTVTTGTNPASTGK